MSRSESGQPTNDDYWYRFGYGALDLLIESYAFDDDEFGDHGLENETLFVDDVLWDELVVRGAVEIDVDLFDFVLEDDERAESATTVIVRGNCISTHTRLPVAEVHSPKPGRNEIEFRIRQDDFANVLELKPVLIRSTKGSSRDHRFGQTPGLRLADGPSFNVVLDEKWDEKDGFLEVKTKEFDGHPPEENLYYLDHSVPSQPVLLVNSGVNLLPAILESKAPHGRKRWTKEVISNTIGHGTWFELIMWTIADIEDGECRHEWQRHVIDFVKKDLYDGESTEEVIRDLEEKIGDPNRIPLLINDVSEVVQTSLEPSDDVEKLLEEVL